MGINFGNIRKVPSIKVWMMISENKARDLLMNADINLVAYNDVYRSGYKSALRDVLEIKLPKAYPASREK